MENDPPDRSFTAEEAGVLAIEVFDFDASTERPYSLVPRDVEAANAAISALADIFDRLPKTIRTALEGAANNGALISDDRLQGLAELIQNADDLAANNAAVTIDFASSRLIFQHDGLGLTLHDVLGLSIPWLSLKASNAEQTGRFGIGLKTLQSLSPVLDVHHGFFHIRISDRSVAAIPEDDSVTGKDSKSLTTFVIPFESGHIDPGDIAIWLENWGEAGLIFLRNLHTITLLGDSKPIVLHVDRSEPEQLDFGTGEVTRHQVKGGGERSWTTYRMRAIPPPDSTRTRKAMPERVALDIGFPKFEGDTGHIHVGLPVRPIGLPFRFNAPFDPLANRRDLASSNWNLVLMRMICDLWLNAAIDQFNTDPTNAWRYVPLEIDLNKDVRTIGDLRNVIAEQMLTHGRAVLAETVHLPWNGERFPLSRLAYESPELTGLISAGDISELARSDGAIALEIRSSDSRWRAVLADLRTLDVAHPTEVGVKEALPLLEDPSRTPEFTADLLALAIEAGLQWAISEIHCLVLANGDRTTPQSHAGLNALVSSTAGSLWSILGIGAEVHSAYRERRGWASIRDWLVEEELLLEDATDYAAMKTLSSFGRSGQQMPDQLSDTQLESLRLALEQLNESDRRALGLGIGKAIRVGGQTYDREGKRQSVTVSPAQSYYFENEANNWGTAAAQTPNLLWIERRYGRSLRPSTADGLGAQRFFRLLGAEVAPRLITHRQPVYRFSRGGPGVHRDAVGSPPRRYAKLVELGATYTLADQESPDLIEVLGDIANLRDDQERVRRTRALLIVLNRAWERLEPNAHVSAVSDVQQWNVKGRVDAWWIAKAASTPWLAADDGSLAAPENLLIRTPANVALFGDEPNLYLAEALVGPAYSNVLTALGVRGDPGPEELLVRLGQIAREFPDSHMQAADLSAALYSALGKHIRAGISSPQRVSIRKAFDRGSGLVITNSGWRRPSVVFAGLPIFGGLGEFVPSAEGAEPLWDLLSIRHPDGHDALRVLKELAKRNSSALARDQELIMVESLRILAATPPEHLPRLLRSPVWVGDCWTTERPVYVVGNPLIQRELTRTLKVWAPGGALDALQPLVTPYGLTQLELSNARVLSLSEAVEDTNLTTVFAAAVSVLREDLAFSDPASEQSLSISWDEFLSWRVCRLPSIDIEITNPTDMSTVRLQVPAWAELESSTFFVSTPDEIGRPEGGAHAVASLFKGDARRIAHDWVVAWAKASDGARAEKTITAASLDADLKRNRSAAADKRLLEITSRPKKRPDRTAVRIQRQDQHTEPTISVPQPRLLIDLDDFALNNPDGSVADKQNAQRSADSTRASRGLREPSRTNPWRASSNSSRGHQNYTPEERESMGLEIARWVLGLDSEGVVDLRKQHNVGADAVDQLDNFYELKVHSGAIPDQVRLEPSELKRALATDKFFLVLVGNIEKGSGDPEVRVIVDPLKYLSLQSSSALRLSGIHSAPSLTFVLERKEV